MADSYVSVANCIKMGSSTVGIGVGAGAVHASGTGGMFLGHAAGNTNVTGTNIITIGKDSDISASAGDGIAIGAPATVFVSESGTSDCVAIGYNASCAKINSIVLGGYDSSISRGPSIVEYGRGHQTFYTVTTTNTNLNLSGTTGAMAIIGGWIEFIDIAAARTLTLPSYADLRAVMPNSRHNTTGEFLIHNFNSGNYNVNVTAGTGTYWESVDPIRANDTQIVYYRVVEIDPYYTPPYISYFA